MNQTASNSNTERLTDPQTWHKEPNDIIQFLNLKENQMLKKKSVVQVETFLYQQQEAAYIVLNITYILRSSGAAVFIGK